MSDYEQWEKGDPFEVVARREAKKQREERECGECIHKRPTKDGFKCVFTKRLYGWKCELWRKA